LIDGNLLTSTRPGAAIEIALKLLEILSSAAFAQEIRARMRIPSLSPGWYHAAQV
jgi:4-methyl-5(b-hydroxyethyl)-thiazole monophosphate biosynthesis